jgi:putative peptide zinc metalloprotease protein
MEGPIERLRLGSGIVIDPAVGQHRIVHKPATREYFRLGVREAGFLEALDGSRDQEALARDNGFGFNVDEVEFLLAWFSEKRLLAGQTEFPCGDKRGVLHRIRDFILDTQKWRLHIGSPDAYLNKNLAIVNAVFSTPALAVYLCLLFLPIALLIVSPATVNHALSEFNPVLPGWHWFALYAALLLMNVLHEMSHAVACKYFGGKVEKIGIMLMYLQPVLYCDVSDSWRFRKVSEKITVASAGIVMQLLLAAVSGVVFLFSGWSVLLMFAMINLVIAIFNLIPFVKLDGYWILVHFLEEPQLQKKGLRAVDSFFRRLFRRSAGRVDSYSSSIIAFGIGHIIAVPAFWILGLYSIYRYASRLSDVLAVVLLSILAMPLLFRAIKGGGAYLHDVFANGGQAR